jgi:TusE/DsrC/DsvC family sulfur relay protein
MEELHYSEKKVELDKDGFLTNNKAWDNSVADLIAKREGIEHLSKKQRDIIYFLRSYYHKHENFPILGNVCKSTRQRGKCVDLQFNNPEKAWEIAGLPKIDGVHFISHDDGKHFIMEDYC